MTFSFSTWCFRFFLAFLTTSFTILRESYADELLVSTFATTAGTSTASSPLKYSVTGSTKSAAATTTIAGGDKNNNHSNNQRTVVASPVTSSSSTSSSSSNAGTPGTTSRTTTHNQHFAHSRDTLALEFLQRENHKLMEQIGKLTERMEELEAFVHDALQHKGGSTTTGLSTTANSSSSNGNGNNEDQTLRRRVQALVTTNDTASSSSSCCTKVEKKVNRLKLDVNELKDTTDALEVSVDALTGDVDVLMDAMNSLLETLLPASTAAHCGCDTCTDSSWAIEAPAGSGPTFTCGSRIEFKMSEGLSELDACRFVAGLGTGEFPTECAPCDPDRCSTGVPSSGGTPDPLHQLLPETEIYCYPPYADRQRFTNLWGDPGFIVETKRSDSICGPGNNYFSDETVSVAGNELMLEFKQVNGQWTAAEVRVVLPQDQMPYRYGVYQFSVKSVTHKSSDGTVLSNTLPVGITLGLFTWDTQEDYATHENYNHEVDIEISRWNVESNHDVNFLIQPPEPLNYGKLFSGANSGYDQGGHTYSFDWRPTEVIWNSDANGGLSFSYKTLDAVQAGLPDRIQCLPATMEVRLNLWHMNGAAVPPVGLSDGEIVQVVIDNFSYTPNVEQEAPDGSTCSKDCQCLPTSSCVSSVCIAS